MRSPSENKEVFQEGDANCHKNITNFRAGLIDDIRLYVGIEDNRSRTSVVVRPGPAAAGTPGWSRWAVPLGEFAAAGVDLTAVTTMYIGLGGRDAPVPGGAGLIYSDDIRVTKP